MPLKQYGVLKGKAVAAKREDGLDTPHYQVQIKAGGTDYRIAINVKSQESPSDLLYLVDQNFHHPITSRLPALKDGFAKLEKQPGGIGLDFIRANLFDRLDMKELPSSLPGPNNDLSDLLELYVKRAISDSAATFYVFGERWGPESGQADKIFGFRPGNGIHDIHMNQGNSPNFRQDDGVWQDGGLILHYPNMDRWVGVFLAFQSQAWHTDDQTGHALDVPERGRLVRIVGALVNPKGADDGKETVCLLNASPDAIDLTGWQLADRLKNKCGLSGTLAPGATMTIKLPASVQLGNGGGTITLLDRGGLKVDGVSYTAADANAEGWMVVF